MKNEVPRTITDCSKANLLRLGQLLQQVNWTIQTLDLSKKLKALFNCAFAEKLVDPRPTSCYLGQQTLGVLDYKTPKILKLR